MSPYTIDTRSLPGIIHNALEVRNAVNLAKWLQRWSDQHLYAQEGVTQRDERLSWRFRDPQQALLVQNLKALGCLP